MAPPRTRSTDDPAGQTSQVEDSATVTAVDEPAADAAASESTPAVEAPIADEQLEEQPVVDAPPPVGRPPLAEVAEASARGAFPTDAQEG